MLADTAYSPRLCYYYHQFGSLSDWIVKLEAAAKLATAGADEENEIWSLLKIERGYGEHFNSRGMLNIMLFTCVLVKLSAAFVVAFNPS